MTFSSPNGASAVPPTRGRILVVEDDPEAAHFFWHVLTRRGRFHVNQTADPTIALALAAVEPWDLLLTDLDLPVMSGFELVASLRRIQPGVPAVLTTAHLVEAPVTAPGGGRPDKILRKPVPASDLLGAVHSLTARGNRTGHR